MSDVKKRFIGALGAAVMVGVCATTELRAWNCSYNFWFEWCGEFNVHSRDELGGAASTAAYPGTECEDAFVEVESWLSGPDVSDDGYSYDGATYYAESSSASDADPGIDFIGIYTLHSNHYYEGDWFTCGMGTLEENRTIQREIT